ncbi:acyltransferase family protein [Yersinia enterocolitica]
MRDLSIDVFRGVCILFVVLGHTDYIPKPLMDLIYSFHMPAFFILSGYLFNTGKKQKLLERVNSRFKRLIIPAWILGLICGVPFLLMLATGYGGITYDIFLTKLYGTLTGYPSYSHTFNSTPLWFLFSLFVVDIIATYIFSITDRAVIALYIIGGLGVVISQITNQVTPFNILISLVGVLFFSIGVSIREIVNSNIHFDGRIILTLSFVIFSFGNVCFSSPINMATNTIGHGLSSIYNIIVATCGTIFIAVLSTYISKIKKMSKYIAWLGVNTIPIVAFDYYANNIILFAHQWLELPSLWYSSFIIKVIILSIVAYLISIHPKFNRIINCNS